MRSSGILRSSESLLSRERGAACSRAEARESGLQGQARRVGGGLPGPGARIEGGAGDVHRERRHRANGTGSGRGGGVGLPLVHSCNVACCERSWRRRRRRSGPTTVQEAFSWGGREGDKKARSLGVLVVLRARQVTSIKSTFSAEFPLSRRLRLLVMFMLTTPKVICGRKRPTCPMPVS